MTIIAYRNSKDLDIKFEDGSVIKNKSYSAFKKGQIAHPIINTNHVIKNKLHVGETKVNNKGYQMTIIAYRNSKDIDVQFEDGTIVTNKDYSGFKKGVTRYPENKIGKTNIATNGMKMTIIEYRDSHDIDVRFEDGTVIKNKSYSAFKNGEIACVKNGKLTKRLGETIKSNNGLNMTIIAYRGTTDIDVQFEDGAIVKNKTYGSFKKGEISHPDKNTFQIHKGQQHIGETNIAKNGLKMTIITYRKNNDIDIEFEDGTIVKNKNYSSFKKGTIKHPHISGHQPIINKIGETNIAKNGMKMTIIAYRNSNDIDIEFEDGTIVKNKAYKNFKNKSIRHPKIFADENKKYVLDKIGETIKASNGLKMTIIAYRKCNDVDIQFEDGIIVKHKQYHNFKNGRISHPEINPAIPDRMGDTVIAHNGMRMTIINYYDAKNIDIQFEDGLIVRHRPYGSFKRGQIKHPFPYQMDNIVIDKFAYIHNSIGQFYCHCTKCDMIDIMSINEMKNHKCKTCS